MLKRRLSTLLLSLLLAAVTAQAAIPSPREVLGFEPGEDRKLADWNQVLDYFRKVAEADPSRVLFKELGKSTEGRPFVVLTISAPENIARLDHYREVQARLADPRGLSDPRARALIEEGKAVVLITCTIHSTEVASTLTSMEFVYRLLTQDTARHAEILKNTIFLLVPSLNPDGLDLVTAWYRKTLGTRYEGSLPPFLYQKYTGHDDNRDWYMMTQQETRLTVAGVHNVWHPQVVYDMHQMGSNAARIFTPPWLDPIEPNIDPLLVSESNMLGTAIAADLATEGKKGVAVNAMYDYWTPARHYQSYHGGLRILTESASARLASPITVRFDQLDTNALGYNARQSSWNFPDPWPGGTWRLRDIVDYQLIAMEACLYRTAQNREMFLRNFYQIGRRAIAPRARGPVAFLVPDAQHDPGNAAKMLNVLRFGLVEMARARKPFTADGLEYRAGTYVVDLEQPYGAYARTLLERQQYPDLRLYPGGPPRRPYDVTAHTLPLLMGVDTVAVTNRFRAETEPVTADIVPPVGRVAAGSEGEYFLRADSNAAYIAVNRLLKTAAAVSRTEGGFLVHAQAAMLEPLARELGVSFEQPRRQPPGAAPGEAGRALSGRFAASGQAPNAALHAPRIALYKSYVPSMDEGWTRYVLEQYEFPYTSVFDKDIRDGRLNDRFDVLVIADMSARAIVNGNPASGNNVLPEEYTGGIGEAGVQQIRDFVARGGTVVLLNRASQFGIERLGVPARDVLAGVPPREFYAPGSLLRIELDARHPLALGMPRDAAAWFEQGLAFEPLYQSQSPEINAVASFPDGNPLLSGWLLGDKLIQKRYAVIDAPMGQGHAVLFGIRPQYRAQSYGTYKLLFNALYYF